MNALSSAPASSGAHGRASRLFLRIVVRAVGRAVGRAQALLPQGVPQGRALVAGCITALLAACGGGANDASTAAPTAAARVTTAVSHTTAVSSTGVRFVRLQALSEINGNPWASMAEFNLVDGNGATLSRAGWTVTADSQETQGETAPATSAIDGDPNSFWHTQWYAATPGMPHTFTVNLGSSQTIGGFKYLPRQGGDHGRIANYQFFTSADGVTWTLAVQGTFPLTTAETTVMLSTAPTLAAIGDRIDPLGVVATQIVSASDASGATLGFAATGLPPGLAINAATGAISGTPTLAGVYSVTVQASDTNGTSSDTFVWTIAATAGASATPRYVRLQALSEVNGNPWTSVAEFNVIDTGSATLSRAGWVATADSQETVGAPNAVSGAIDGNTNTFWQTQWQTASPGLPHMLTVDLGSARSVGGFKILPRQDGPNGRIANYRFYTSTDGVNWTLVTTGTWPNTSAEQTVTLAGTTAPAPVNNPPTIAAITNRSDVSGKTVTQAVSASDIDGDTLTYAASGLPTGVIVNTSSGLMSGVPTTTGTFAVTVQVSDGKAAVSTSFNWSVTAATPGVNHPPTVAPIALRNDATGVAVSVPVVATDADGDALSYSAGGLPFGITINPSTGVMSGTPTTPAPWSVNVVVSDGKSTVVTSFVWVVSAGAPAVNHAPTVAALPNRSDTAGQAASVTVSASDADGDQLTYAATGLPPGIAINASTGLLSGTPTTAGTFGTNVQVSDGKTVASTGFTWTVVAAPVTNHPPTIVAIANRSDVAAQAVTQAVSASDVDGDTLAFSATGLPTGVTINIASGLVSGTPTAAGTFNTTIQVSDGKAIASTTFVWTIGAAQSTNHPPTIAAIANRSDVSGKTVAQAASAGDVDGDTLTYSASGLPTGVSVNTASGLMSGVPTTTGTFGVTVQVSDGKTAASTSFVWSITAATAPGVNHPPTVAPIALRNDATGVAVSVPVVATDADGDALSYSAGGLPFGITINPSTGVMSGTPTTPAPWSVNVVVSDGKSTVVTSFVWVVSAGAPGAPPANHAPTVAALPNRSDTAGQAISVAISASDADGDQLTYAATGLPPGIAINASTGLLSGTPTTAGTFGTSVQVSDGKTVASTSFTWTVVAAPVTNHPPTIATIANRSNVAGQAVTQAVSASDQDGDALTYSATGLPNGVTIGTSTGLMSGTPTAAGTFNTSVSVSDGKAITSTAFVWTITAAQNSPATSARFVRLEALSEVNGNPWTSMAEFNVVGSANTTLSRAGWTVAVDSQETVGENAPATNALDGDASSYWHTQWQGAAPSPPHTFTVDMGSASAVAGFRYLPRQNSANGRIANYRFWTSADGVSWQVVTQGTFVAGSAAEQSGTVTAGITNHAPTLASIATPRTDTSGTSVAIALSASDADGDALTYAATGLPTGVAINASTGAIAGMPSIAGTYHVKVTVLDGRGGSAERLFDWIIVAAANPTNPTNPTNPSAPGSSGTNPPVVFNAPASAAAGDIVSLQGDGFGTSPVVFLDANPTVALAIVNSVGTGWLAVQIPSTATGSLTLRVKNSTGTSAAVRVNAARPDHLDVQQLNPGGPFRIYGRNLLMTGSTPSVSVNGVAATVDTANSNENMLSATVPATVAPAATSTIAVDNGNGSGATVLDRPAAIVSSGSGDPFGLGVGWASTFTALTSNTIFPATDSRIGDKAQCNGSHNDAGAIQTAINLAVSAGGGVVQLPSGRCLVGNTLSLSSNVVVRGAGKASTELYYSVSGYPFVGIGVDRVGLSDLTITEPIDGGDGMLFKNSTRVFIHNVKINLGTSKQMFLDGNVNFVVSGSDFVQTGNANLQGPYLLINSGGLVFENNTTTWVSGAPTFGRIHDAVVRNNRFSRNATDQNNPSTVHSLTLDFAYRVAVVGNTFDMIGGPMRNKTRNDGETILSEGGGAGRTENTGFVSSATSLTLTDPASTLNMDPFGEGRMPENYGVAIVSGRGMGQMRHVTGYSAGTHTLTVDRAWDVVPDGSSHYVSYVAGLEVALIKGNALSQGPRGIWLYNSVIHDVAVVANTISEGGGIYLRSYQNVGTKIITPIYTVLVKDNRISDSTREWMAYINIVQVNNDGSAFGTGTIGIEVRNNFVTANVPNFYSNEEEYAGTEGMKAYMPLETYGYYETTTIPRVLGTIFTGNTCTNCDVAVRLGTGSTGTTIVNQHLVNSPTLFTDTSSVSTGELSTATVIR